MSKIFLLKIQILQSRRNLKNAQKLQKEITKINLPFVLMLTEHIKLKK
jgi:hypothetical protein